MRALVVTVLAAGLTVLLPGPPLFSTQSSPFSGTAARASSGQSLDANAGYRTEFWREALVVVRAHPIVGAGYGRLAEEAESLVPRSWALSPLAHSGPLQALAGGLLLGLPVLVGLGVIALGLLRRIRVRVRSGADTALVAAGAVTALALVAHSLVDTDWSYPALAGQFAVVVGLTLAARPARAQEPVPEQAPDPAQQAPPVNLWAATGSAVLALTLAVGCVVAWGQPFHISELSAPQTVTGEVHP